jgi:hypothetical protein
MEILIDRRPYARASHSRSRGWIPAPRARPFQACTCATCSLQRERRTQPASIPMIARIDRSIVSRRRGLGTSPRGVHATRAAFYGRICSHDSGREIWNAYMFNGFARNQTLSVNFVSGCRFLVNQSVHERNHASTGSDDMGFNFFVGPAVGMQLACRADTMCFFLLD